MFAMVAVVAWCCFLPGGLTAQKTAAEKLVSAAARGDLDEVKKLLADGASPDARSSLGLTALHASRMNGYTEVAELLLAKGADAGDEMPAPADLADRFLRSRVKGKSPGLAVLVARDGKILFEKGYGYACLAHEVPVTPSTKFRIGSITKQFTATAVLRLQEDGKLSVRDKLAKFIPDYPRGDEVTIEHLLTHTSGIHSYTSKPGFFETVTVPITPEKLIESFRNDAYDFDPGEQWLYNNSGYFLLGHIIAKVSGRSYGEFLRDQLFEPLGMRATGVHDSRAILAHEATGYSYEKGKFKKALNWDMSRAGGAGALYSTVEDLYRWNEGIFNGRVLSQASREAAFTPVKVSSGKKEHPYGYGWGLGPHRGLEVISHAGGLHGFLSYLARYPGADFTVVALTNCSPAPPELNPTAVAQRIAVYFLWSKMKPRKARVVAKGIDAAVYDRYVGRYDYGSAVLTVTRKGEHLFARLGRQRAFEIFPRSETVFFWKAVDAEITFVKDRDGKVLHAVHRQGGRTTKAPRLADQIVAKVDPAVFPSYAGKYDYGMGKVLTVTEKDGRLFAQLTGQPALELLPRSETAFFWKDVNAEITFVKNEQGKVVKGIHRQHQRTFDVPRMK